uniref:DUF4614 domain-containing protein n=1 Tax=Oryzias sinensis TaxID=183150 RepID=A0A8C7X809_9TELE
MSILWMPDFTADLWCLPPFYYMLFIFLLQDESRQSDPAWCGTHQQLSQEDEEVLDYHSDFHSYSSGTQISEELSDEEGTPSEIRTDGADSVVSSHTPPKPRRRASQTSLASVRVSSKQRSSSSRKHLKNAAAQTQPDHLIHDDASVPPAVARFYLSAASGRGYALTAEQLEDIGTYNPAVFVVNEVLKQQLAMIKESVDSSRHLHSSLMQSLEPPSYRYTTLQDTIQNIRRPAKLAMERHLEEVLQNLHSGKNEHGSLLSFEGAEGTESGCSLAAQYGSLKGYRGCPASLGTRRPST